MIETPALNVAAGQRAGADHRGLPAAHRPTAVFCANDLLALGVLQEMTARRIRVPEDSRSSATTTSTSPPPPRCRCPRCASPGTSSAAPPPSCCSRRRSATARHQHRQVVFEPELVVRASSASARTGADRPRKRPAGGGRLTHRCVIALFVTCLADTLFPDVGQGDRAAARAARPRGRVPARRRPAAGRCTSTPATSARRCRWSAATSRSFERLRGDRGRPSGSCAGSVRHQHAMVARRVRRRGAGRAAPRRWPRAPTSCPSSWSTCSGSTDVGAYYPHRVTYHPTCHSLRLLRVGDRPLRLLRAVRGHRPGRAARRRGVLRLRRHVRGQERRHVDGDAGRQDAQRAGHPAPRSAPPGDNSCLMHIGGGLSRLQRRHPDRPPGRDPRRDRGRPEPGMRRRCCLRPRARHAHRAAAASGHLRGDDPFPVAARARAGRHPAAPQPRQGHRAPSAPSGPPWSASCPTGRQLREAGQAIKAAHDGPPDRYLEQLEEQVTARGGTVHWARDAAEANRIVTDLVQRHRGRPRWSRSSRWPPRRSASTRRSPRPGITRLRDRPGRADRPARPRPAVAHPGAGDPPQPGRDPRDLPARDGRRRPGPDRRPGRARRGGPAAPAAQVPVRAGRRSAARTSPSPRPARCAWSSPRATAGCA